MQPAVLAVTGGGDATSIGPGLAGFLAIFAITLASWVLFRSMSKHLRRVRHSPDPSASPPEGAGPTDVARPGSDGDRDAGSGPGPGHGEPGPPFHEEPPGGQRR